MIVTVQGHGAYPTRDQDQVILCSQPLEPYCDRVNIGVHVLEFLPSRAAWLYVNQEKRNREADGTQRNARFAGSRPRSEENLQQAGAERGHRDVIPRLRVNNQHPEKSGRNRQRPLRA